MSATIEFIFDFGTPNAYLAYRALPSILARTGAKLIINPCLLGGIFKATGNQAPAVAFAGRQGQARIRDAGIAPLRREAPARQVPHEPAFPRQHAHADARAHRRPRRRPGSRLSRDGPSGPVGRGPEARRSAGSGAEDRRRRPRFRRACSRRLRRTGSSSSLPTTPRPPSRAACSGFRPFSLARKCSSARSG